MTRRRQPGELDVPLFEEDWWVTDQQLFQDSVDRQAAPPAQPKPAAGLRFAVRTRRPVMAWSS